MEKFERKNPIYNEEIEKEISTITNYYDWCETREDENIINDLLELYEETKYPGILYCIGEIYLQGYNKCEVDEEKGINYLKQAAEEGYAEAMDSLGMIYSGKASQALMEAKYWYDKLGLDYNDAHGKLYLGNNLMAQYLIASSGTHYNGYDLFYEGLALVAESFQMGNYDAQVILNVLDKDKEFAAAYNKKIDESIRNLIKYRYDFSEDDLCDIDEVKDRDCIFDEEFIFEEDYNE